MDAANGIGRDPSFKLLYPSLPTNSYKLQKASLCQTLILIWLWNPSAKTRFDNLYGLEAAAGVVSDVVTPL